MIDCCDTLACAITDVYSLHPSVYCRVLHPCARHVTPCSHLACTCSIIHCSLSVALAACAASPCLAPGGPVPPWWWLYSGDELGASTQNPSRRDTTLAFCWPQLVGTGGSTGDELADRFNLPGNSEQAVENSPSKLSNIFKFLNFTLPRQDFDSAQSILTNLGVVAALMLSVLIGVVVTMPDEESLRGDILHLSLSSPHFWCHFRNLNNESAIEFCNPEYTTYHFGTTDAAIICGKDGATQLKKAQEKNHPNGSSPWEGIIYGGRGPQTISVSKTSQGGLRILAVQRSLSKKLTRLQTAYLTRNIWSTWFQFQVHHSVWDQYTAVVCNGRIHFNGTLGLRRTFFANVDPHSVLPNMVSWLYCSSCLPFFGLYFCWSAWHLPRRAIIYRRCVFGGGQVVFWAQFRYSFFCWKEHVYLWLQWSMLLSFGFLSHLTT